MTKLSWLRFSCWRVRRTTLSVTCRRPGPPSPRPGPPPTPSTVLPSSRQRWTCSQVRRVRCSHLQSLHSTFLFVEEQSLSSVAWYVHWMALHKPGLSVQNYISIILTVDLLWMSMITIIPCSLCRRNHPRGRGEGLEDGLLLLLWGLRGLRLRRPPQSRHRSQIHAAVQNCSELVSFTFKPQLYSHGAFES